jgi:hypothetical protein
MAASVVREAVDHTQTQGFMAIGKPSDPLVWSRRGVTPEATPMDFPILDLMDEPACYRRLTDLLHPDGLA